MIGTMAFHALSGESGVIDAVSTDPSGTVLVRINDRWFFASDTVEVAS